MALGRSPGLLASRGARGESQRGSEARQRRPRRRPEHCQGGVNEIMRGLERGEGEKNRNLTTKMMESTET